MVITWPNWVCIMSYTASYDVLSTSAYTVLIFLQKKVRQWIFRDYYVPDISQEERDEWAAHISRFWCRHSISEDG